MLGLVTLGVLVFANADKAPRLRQTDVKKASLLAASAQHEGLPHGVGAPRPFGRSFHDAPVGNTDWVTHRQRIFVISDMDPTAPMDRLDGSSDHASLTGAMPAKPGGETVLTLDDGKPPMAPDRMLSKRALKPRTFPERGGVLDRESPLSNEAVAPVDRVPPYVSRYLEQRANLEQNRVIQKRLDEEWTRADVNKDGVVSEEEFTMELKDRQAKKKDEIERLWQRFHQSEDKFMSKEEYFRLARTGYDLGTITRDDVASVMTPDNMKGLGYWGAGATCPPRSFAMGVRIKKMEASISNASVDDSGVNAVKFLCSNGSEVSTAEGPDGDWSNWTLCPKGQRVYGFRSQGHSFRKGLDNAGITGLEFSCRKPDMSDISRLSFSNFSSFEVAWSKELRCVPGSAICGAQANLVKDAKDSMGIADLRVYCCELPVDCSEICTDATRGMKLVKCRACQQVMGGNASEPQE
ncbi:unnamed protein product [Durusdinium trenchii]|uniref:EF-hand domain-containing protein n=1 Tax=Durusdinium trenchii TaxID=1381693 RepID=A0ABP0Q6F3_9DINO